MNFFKPLAAILTSEVTATIVIRKTASGKLSVSTSFNTEKGASCEGLVPFLLKGTPEEMDEGYIEALRGPAEQVTGLVSNYEQFQKAARAAKDNLSKKSTINTSAADAMKKAEQERKAREEAAKKRADTFNDLVIQSENATGENRFYTADAYLEMAEGYTDDKKLRAEIAKRRSGLKDEKGGLICSDTEADGKAAAQAYRSKLEAAPKSEAPAETEDEPEESKED